MNDTAIVPSEEMFEKDYIPYINRWGLITNLLGVLVSFFPALVCTFAYKLNPGIGPIIAGFVMQASVSGVFWFVEPISYFPVLGVPDTYMAFLSGNIGNLRLPASVAAQNAAGVEPGTDQGTIIATIGVAVSIIVNIAFLTAGVVLGSSVLSMLPKPVIMALKNILPALFGAMLAQQFIPNPQIGTVAVVLAGGMILLNKAKLLAFLPGNPVYAVIIVAVFGSILIRRFMHDKGIIKYPRSIHVEKRELFGLVDVNEAKLREMALSIWEHPEAGFNERWESKLQRDYLSANGFKVRDVPNVATGFVAEYGNGNPIIGILGDYDALPGLSQKVSDVREAYDNSGFGHGCGHNLLGTGGVGAALAIKQAMDNEGLKGTVRYYGCPAEELLSGKVAMAKEKVFEDLDSCVSWHPSSMNVVWGCSFMAMNSIKFRFKGIPAIAAAAPQAGRSALDAVELMNVGANYLREHIMEKARIHYVITNGGMAPNIVPEDAEVWYYIRAPKRAEVREIAKRLTKIAQGAAMMTETTMSQELLAGCYDVVSNLVLSDLMHENMLVAGPPKYSDEDRRFGKELSGLFSRDDKAKVMTTYFAPDRILDMSLCEEIVKIDDRQKVMAGSTDVGDVSYIAPLAQITAATWPVGTAAHTWVATASSGSGIGLSAMIFASKVMCGTVYDLLKNPALVAAAKAEFKKSTGGATYVSPYAE